jgi:SpoVK/Ycf46/Vps4 family AAA+-type ATPase
MEAFQKLRRAGRVCFSPERHELPMRLRTNSLVIGPSGCGKTHLAFLVGESLGVACKSLNTSEWILLGSGSSAGARKTWHSIFDFLVENQSKKGAMIFLDEIDKINGTTDWTCHLRVEVFHLLDHSVPGDLVSSSECRIDPELFKAVSETLKNRTFIVGAGAFQGIWEARDRPACGFLTGNQEREVPPTSNILANYLPRELVNRFCTNITTIPMPGPSDYENMLLGLATRLPKHLQDRFLSLGEARIPEACQNKQGVRFIEELLTDMIAEDVDPSVPILPETSIWRREPHRTYPPNMR